MTNYLISTAGNSLSISKELHKLSQPDYSNGNMIFDVINHPSNGETALVVEDLDYEILVHPNNNLDNLKTLLTAYDEAAKAELEAYIDTIAIEQVGEEPASGWVLGRFPFRNVVEGYVDIHDQQYMFDNGWPVEDPSN